MIVTCIITHSPCFFVVEFCFSLIGYSGPYTLTQDIVIVPNEQNKGELLTDFMYIFPWEFFLRLGSKLWRWLKMIKYSSVKLNWQQESINNVHLVLLWPYLLAMEHNEVFVELSSECHESYCITFKLACNFH